MTSPPRTRWWQRWLGAPATAAAAGAQATATQPPATFPDSAATLQAIAAVTEDLPVAAAEEHLRHGPLPGLRLIEADDADEVVRTFRYAADVPGVGTIRLTTIQGEVVGIGIEVTAMTQAELQAHVEHLVGQPFHRTTAHCAQVADGTLLSLGGFGEHPELVATRQADSLREFQGSA